jgi:hypothetical protein
MTLRCRKGDLAIVLNSGTGREGAIVSVVEYAGKKTMTNGDVLLNAWKVKPPRPEKKASYFAEDHHLWPILGNFKKGNKDFQEIPIPIPREKAHRARELLNQIAKKEEK